MAQLAGVLATSGPGRDMARQSYTSLRRELPVLGAPVATHKANGEWPNRTKQLRRTDTCSAWSAMASSPWPCPATTQPAHDQAATQLPKPWVRPAAPSQEGRRHNTRPHRESPARLRNFAGQRAHKHAPRTQAEQYDCPPQTIGTIPKCGEDNGAGDDRKFQLRGHCRSQNQ